MRASFFCIRIQCFFRFFLSLVLNQLFILKLIHNLFWL
jgi:hypothetical protein